MNTFFRGLALFFVTLLLTTSCESDNKTLLTDGIWKFSNMTTDSESQDIITLVALGKAILTDGTLEFKTDQTYILTAPLLQDPETGTWSLIGEDQLIMDSDGDLGSKPNIEILTKKELKYIEPLGDSQVNSYSVITTWKRD